MRQQINLFQPIFREERKLFCAKTVGYALGAVVLALFAIWGFGVSKVSALEENLAHIRQQQRAQEHMVTTTGALRSARANPVDVQARIAHLSKELSERKRALGMLHGGAAGETAGFAAQLTALARQSVDGLWLEHLVLVGTSGSMSLSGRTINADLVPRYLKALASEPALQGTRFDDFVIERPDDEAQPGVQFRAGTVSIEREPSEERT